MMKSDAIPHRVVVVGGGFGGVEAVKRLTRAPVEVTLVDRRNFHLFQPLTYQVATGALTPGEIAYPLRALFKRAPNVRVLMAEVTGFDLGAREVRLASVTGTRTPRSLPYDTLIVAAGSTYSYFGHHEWSNVAPEVKSLESAVAARARILNAFEAAEMEPEAAARRAELSFVIVGGGPTGVEMAGQIGEIARDTLRSDFRTIDSRDARIALVEAGDRLLPGFPPSLSAKAARSLEQLGVTPIVQRTVLWAAGVRASTLAAALGQQAGVDVDPAGRLTVEGDLTLKSHQEVIALGDMVRIRRATGEVEVLPGLAPVAIQQGRYAGRLVCDRIRGGKTPLFRYRDRGNLATIGRARAVADLHFVRLSGPLAWVVWLVVHLWYLIGFQNRLLVMTRWGFSFLTRGRGARLITSSAAVTTE
jgi:NADH:ubiquinone reductase (H+-translocating)